MDESVKSTLESYRGMIATYEGKVPDSNPKMRELKEFYQSIYRIGENAGDYFDFNDKTAHLNWMTKFSELLTAVAMEGLNSNSAKPTVAQAASGYHKAFEALPAEGNEIEKKIYREIFAVEKESGTPAEFMKLLVQRKLLVRLAKEPAVAMYESALEKTKGLSLPTMELFNQQAAAAMKDSRNVAEIEYQTNRLALLSNLETMWDQAATQTIYISVGGAVAAYEMAGTEENREKVENSVRFIGDYFSLSVEAMLALPRVADYIRAIIVPPILKIKPQFSYEVYVRETLETVAKCLKDKPAVVVSNGFDFIEFYGKKIPLSQWHSALKNPPRPEILNS